MDNPYLLRIFWLFNKLFMVPIFRMGLGPFLGNPLTGYIMVIKNFGRVTRKTHYTPVNYAILKGNVYCIAGFGKTSHWYRNIQSEPNVELILPSGPLSGIAEDVKDPTEAKLIVRQVLKNGGFAGFFLGFNPFTVSDEVLSETLKGLPVVKIRPTGVGSGASDAGGWLWILVFFFILWFILR